MKFNKQIAIILLLSSLLISSIAVIFSLYEEKKKMENEEAQLVTVYIATQTLEKGTLIKDSHLRELQIRKKDILNIPLTKEEIIGKYTNEKIYKNEIFLKIRVTDKIKIEEKKVVKIEKKEFNFNSYNIPFQLFSNPNYSLKPNDTINIVSVYQNNNSKYSVQYIAKNLNVIGFLIEGKESKKPIQIKNFEDKNIEIKAEEIVLDIHSKTVLELIKDYNKGKQLWMIKTIKDQSPIPQKTIPTKMVTDKKTIKKPTSKKKIQTQKAIIEYKDNPKLNKVQIQEVKKPSIKKKTTTEEVKKPIQEVKNSIIEKQQVLNELPIKNKEEVIKDTDLSNRCKKPNNTHLLLAVKKNAYIQEKPSLKSDIVAKRDKDSLFRYRQKIENDWYELCEGYYIHTNFVKEISYKDAVEYFKKVRK